MIQRVEAGRELSHGAIADLGATLSEQIARGVTAIHMNTARVVTFDSQALESLLEFDELTKARGLSLVLVDPSEVLSVALTITGLVERLHVHTEAAATVESETPVGSGEPVEAGEPAGSSGSGEPTGASDVGEGPPDPAPAGGEA